MTDVEPNEPEVLATLGDGFVIATVPIAATDPDGARSLRGLQHAIGEVAILGVHHRGRYLGRSPVDLTLDPGDEVVLYGTAGEIAALHGSLQAADGPSDAIEGNG